jgi:hypothetical protein
MPTPPSTSPATAAVDAMSRRQALGAAGLLAAGATAVGTAAASEAAFAGLVGMAPAPALAAAFHARLFQTGAVGERFTALAYLTGLAGVDDAELFDGSVRQAGSARYTAVATGDLARRSIDVAVHSIDVEGTLTVYQRAAPGASFDDPASFEDGIPVARFDVTLQDILTVILPGKGIPTLNGMLTQTLAGTVGGGPRRFGRPGARSRFFATGIGTLVDPVTLNSVLEMAGNWVIE